MKSNKPELVLAIGDLHEPAGHPDAADFVSWVADSWSFDPGNKSHRVVFLGDVIDAHAMSRYPADPDLESPSTELELAIDALRTWYQLFPEADVMVSNHDMRPFRAAFLAGLPRSVLRDYGEWLDAPPGWVWSEQLTLDSDTGPVQFLHGDGFSGKYAGRRAAETHRMNTVIGHVHQSAGVHWITSNAGTIWGCNAGCLVWPTAPVFNYAKWMATKPSLGVLVIANGVPYWEPMLVGSNGRWAG